MPLTRRSADSLVHNGKPGAQEAQDAHLLPTQIVKPEMFDASEAALIDKNQRLPNGTPLNRTPTWSDSPWSEPGNVRHGWELIRKRYADQPEVLKSFEQWAEKTTLPDMGDATVADWLTAENAPRFIGGLGGSGMSAAMRETQNRLIRAGNPARRAPVSGLMQHAAKPGSRQAMEKAALLVDRVHDDGDLRGVVMSNRVLGGGDGSYSARPRETFAQIGVRADSPYPLNTTLHEIGHHLRLELLRKHPGLVGDVAEAAGNSEAAALIKKLRFNTRELLADNELFCRAYAQFIAEESGDPEALREIADMRDGADRFYVFDTADWPRIRGAMRILLSKKGWLRT
ncbi:MAG: hypothetical protein JNM65_06040 [Verrucomicrobiaceae bacterium]|nr:hypothetical protein [Verrucomicrobiaceae bacterium]